MDIKAITEKLEKGVQDVWQSESYRSFLDTMSKFHKYSAHNVLLIMMQCPDASLVAGFKAWHKFDRKVKKGEKAIWIMAPSPRKKTVIKDGEETEIRWMQYVPTTVFDVSQTEGRELPSCGAKELAGDVNNYEEIMEKLGGMASVPVNVKQIDGANGYCSREEIAIREGMSELQNVKTMIHELAHHLLKHTESESSSMQKEVEAESVAYVVAQALGLDTSEYSFSYVAGWAGNQNTDILKATMTTIQKTARTIIEGVTA